MMAEFDLADLCRLTVMTLLGHLNGMEQLLMLLAIPLLFLLFLSQNIFFLLWLITLLQNYSLTPTLHSYQEQ